MPHLILSLILKITVEIIAGNDLKKYPHFQTPLSSIDSVNEAIYYNRANKKYYYLDPNSINQPILII